MFKRKNIEEINDLLRISLAAKDEVISAWKERGDKYAVHNDQLHKEIYRIYTLLTSLLESKDNKDSDFKEMLKEVIKQRK